MGDGEYHATRAGLRASGLDDTPMTQDSQPTPGAAPWERFSMPADDSGLHRWHALPPAEPAEPPAEPADDRSGKGGSHVEGGVSVADLIAKLGAAMPQQPTPHRVATDASNDDVALAAPVGAHAADDVSDDADDQLDTQVIPAYSFQLLSELPNLDELTRDKHGDKPAGTPWSWIPKPSRPSWHSRRPSRKRRSLADTTRCCWPGARWRHCSPCWRWS